MQLSLIEAYTKPKAVLDPLFRLKADIVKVCHDLAYYQKHDPTRILYLKTRLEGGRLLYLLNKYYYDFLQAKEFDHRFHSLLAASGSASPDGYVYTQITKAIIKETDSYTSKPLFLPLPLYYDNAKMATSYFPAFEMKISLDIFGHEAIVLRGHVRDRYFGLLNPYTQPYPTFTQPFVLAEGIDALFTPLDTTFKDSYVKLKGLLRLWYNVSLIG